MSKGPSINGSLKNLKKWVMTSFMDGPKWRRISLGHSIKHKTSFIVNTLGSEFLPASARLCSFFCAKIDFDGFSICLALLWNLKDILRKHGKLPSIYLSYFWNTIVYQTTILKNWIFILTNFYVFVNIW